MLTVLLLFYVCILESENAILLATDVAARGLDIRGIEHVIHYQVPKTAEVFFIFFC